MWDAHSSADFNYHKGRFVKMACHKGFSLAIDEVTTLAGGYDGDLKTGGLDCSACREFLEQATGESCYNENGWSAERVKELNDKSDWRLFYTEQDAWAYWSARKFLETCAKLNLSISFNW